MLILGLGGLLGDAACAVLKDGELRAAIEEAKLTRGLGPGGIPQMAIAQCLRLAGATSDKVDCVAIARPFARGPESLAHLQLRDQFPNSEIVVVEHHVAHAASAYYASPFEDATVLTLDHAGDFRCGARWHASGNQMQLDKEWYYPDSLGRLYRAVTDLLGYRAGGDEHKVQWLSTSGDDRFAGLFREVVTDSARLDGSFFDARGGFGPKFFERMELEPAGKIPEALYPHIAHAVQKRLEDTVGCAGRGGRKSVRGGRGCFITRCWWNRWNGRGSGRTFSCRRRPGIRGLRWARCITCGGRCGGEKRRGDAGSMLLGPSYGRDEIKQVLENCKLRFQYLRSTDELLASAVRMLGEHKILAWMQGRMEFGPRALGNRSILASPLDPYSTENLNVFIKHREPFRKFAASVPEELAAEYFEAGPNARNLATVGRVRTAHRKTFEGAILGRDMVRVHTVSKADNPLFHRLLLETGKSSGLPVLYNTSFNLFGDPLVSTPRDAVRSFYSSGIDALFVGNFLLEK